MKTTKSITIDIEVWSAARSIHPNLSGRIEELLEADIQTKKKNFNSSDLLKELERQKAITSSLQAEIEKRDKEKIKSQKHNFEYIE